MAMMSKKTDFALTLVLSLTVGDAWSYEPPPDCKLVSAGSARVASIIDGDTVLLDDGSQVRLVGIQAPKLPLGRKNYPAWPLAPEAKTALSGLTLGKIVELRYGGERTDRHGRHLAHLFLKADGRWVQGEMLARGLARAYSFFDNRACVTALQTLETKARRENTGIWNLDYYRVRSASDTAELLVFINTFQLVEGQVAATADVRGRVYLNFGKNYRDDFTAVISRRDLRRFRGGSYDPVELKGRKLRVRGWVERHNGPSIDVTHPEQIEILD